MWSKQLADNINVHSFCTCFGFWFSFVYFITSGVSGGGNRIGPMCVCLACNLALSRPNRLTYEHGFWYGVHLFGQPVCRSIGANRLSGQGTVHYGTWEVHQCSGVFFLFAWYSHIKWCTSQEASDSDSDSTSILKSNSYFPLLINCWVWFKSSIGWLDQLADNINDQQLVRPNGPIKSPYTNHRTRAINGQWGLMEINGD